MECPKCGYTIDKNALVCPNCKKVLKLICPICNTVNETNVCSKCGYTIINKCHQCGKINQTIKGRCSKCGFDTNVSAILQGSNIEEFACVSIDFPNLEDMKQILGSKQLYLKFKEKLNGLIYDYVKSVGLRRQIIDNTFIIRFNKDYTYALSAKNALNSAIALLNLITQLNYKLAKVKDVQLKCNIAILKRNAYATSEDYKSGINIQLLYNNIETKKLLNSLQLIADSSIYEIVGNAYPFSSIGMTRVKNQNVFLYELDLTDYIKFEPDEEDSDDNAEIKIPDIIQTQQEILENEESIYDIDGISFEEINCQFTKEMTQGLSSKIVQRFMSRSKNIVVVKGKKSYHPRTQEVVEKLRQNNVFSKVCKVTCYDEIKYKPYGLFNDLISGLYAFSTTGKNKEYNNFAGLNIAENPDFLQDVINLKNIDKAHPEDTREIVFKSIESLLSKMKNTLIVIENIEKIDDSSLEILEHLFKNLEKYELSYLITADNDFSLHRYAHFLLSKVEYVEIRLKPTPIKTLVESNAQLCKNILDTFYFQKISKNTKGSQMYFMQALLHLLDLGIFKVEKGSLVLEKSETVVFPTTLDELIQKRLLFLKSYNANLFKLFAGILLIGPQLDLASVKFFNNSDANEHLKYLDMNGYLTNENGVIQIQNYNLYYDNVMKVLSYDERKVLANFLIMYCFKENSAHPALAKLYSIVENSKNEFIQWENLSNISRSLGDFSAYLNCSTRFLKLLDNNINESSIKSIEEYKLEVYENIANLLYKYTPEKIANITQSILDSFDENVNDKKVINLCNRIMQGCLIAGNYTHALKLAHTMLSRLESADINPSSPNYSNSAFMTALIQIEILFNVGDLEDCITLGDEVFNILSTNSLSSIKPKSLTDDKFMEQVTNAAGYVIFAKVLQLKQDTYKFCEVIERILPNIPPSFKLFVEIDNLLHSKPVSTEMCREYPKEDLFGNFLSKVVQAFSNKNIKPEEFASKIYHAKVAAKENHLNQLELFCDLLIGRSYFKLNKLQKAAVIYNSVLETSINSGLKNITQLAWYSIAELSLLVNDVGSAYGVISNAVVELEKDKNTNIYMLMIFKILQAKALKLKKEENEANLCINQAKHIAEKYSLKINY